MDNNVYWELNNKLGNASTEYIKKNHKFIKMHD